VRCQAAPRRVERREQIPVRPPRRIERRKTLFGHRIVDDVLKSNRRQRAALDEEVRQVRRVVDIERDQCRAPLRRRQHGGNLCDLCDAKLVAIAEVHAVLAQPPAAAQQLGSLLRVDAGKVHDGRLQPLDGLPDRVGVRVRQDRRVESETVDHATSLRREGIVLAEVARRALDDQQRGRLLRILRGAIGDMPHDQERAPRVGVAIVPRRLGDDELPGKLDRVGLLDPELDFEPARVGHQREDGVGNAQLGEDGAATPGDPIGRRWHIAPAAALAQQPGQLRDGLALRSMQPPVVRGVVANRDRRFPWRRRFYRLHHVRIRCVHGKAAYNRRRSSFAIRTARSSSE
jgi:hypothetical protein